VQRSHFPVRSSVLSADALAEQVLPRYALPEPRQCRLIARGVNDTYQVTAGADTFYLRVSIHGWRTREDLDAELALVTDLRERGLSVAPVVPRTDGAVLTSLPAPEGERFAVLFAPAPGESVPDPTTQQARHYGRLAADVHTGADAASSAYRRFHLDECHLLDAPLASIRAAVVDGNEDLNFLELIVERVRRRLGTLPRTPPDYGLCHGDLHPGNVRFVGAGQPTLFDFDCMGYGWRAYDLAVFLWNAFGERRPKRWRETRWRAFRRGYQEVRPLPGGLDEVLPLFLVARQVWLMGLDCADRSGWPPQWITPEWLQTMVRPIGIWVGEYSILAG
jgi:Ser/Thr protein kinase RdoA (MazF antagonist)